MSRLDGGLGTVSSSSRSCVARGRAPAPAASCRRRRVCRSSAWSASGWSGRGRVRPVSGVWASVLLAPGAAWPPGALRRGPLCGAARPAWRRFAPASHACRALRAPFAAPFARRPAQPSRTARRAASGTGRAQLLRALSAGPCRAARLGAGASPAPALPRRCRGPAFAAPAFRVDGRPFLPPCVFACFLAMALDLTDVPNCCIFYCLSQSKAVDGARQPHITARRS